MAEDTSYNHDDELGAGASADLPTVEEFLHADTKPQRRTSRPRIEFENDTQNDTRDSQGRTSAPARDYVAEASDAVRRATKSPSGFLEDLFPGNGNAVLFGIIGLIAAILLFWVGLWRALVLVILIVLGISYGQYLDGKPSIINSIKKLIARLIENKNNR